MNTELQNLITNLFNALDCKKTKPSKFLAKLYMDKTEEQQKHIICCNAKNPVTGNRQFISVNTTYQDTKYLCTNSSTYDIISYFENVVRSVITKQFDITSVTEGNNYSYECCIHTMHHGRQFVAMMEDLKDELINNTIWLSKLTNTPEACNYYITSYFPDIYGDNEEMFKSHIMNYPSEYVYNKEKRKEELVYTEFEFDGDSLVEELEYECYSDIDIYYPYKNMTESLVSYLWRLLDVQFISYIDLDNAVDLKEWGSSYIDSYKVIKNDEADSYFRHHFTDKNIVSKAVDIAIESYKHILSLYPEHKSSYKPIISMLSNLKTEETLEDIFKALRYFNDNVKSSLISAVEELKEF